MYRRIPSVDIRWIRSHQDQRKPYHELSLHAQLNCQADKLAEQAHHLPPLDSTYLFPGNPIKICHKSVPITSNLKKNLRYKLQEPSMIDHVCKTNGWKMDVFHQVDWNAHHQAVMSSNLPSTFINKYLHNILPTGKVICNYQKYYNHCCLSRGEPFEDHFYLPQCQQIERENAAVASSE